MTGTVWIEVRAVLASEPVDWSPFADAFDRHGCPGSLISESPPGVSGYLVSVPASVAKVKELRSDLLRLGALDVEIAEVPEENWAESWRKFFKPRRVGKRFVIRPTWESFEARPEDLEIVLDPGQAFGTGDHPTTRLCLELLEDLKPKGKNVLDLGCGSGILSIAAAKLGADRVLGLDIDPIAVEVAAHNAALNDVCAEFAVSDGIESAAPYAQEVCPAPDPADNRHESSDPRSPTFDIVVSNIISATLIRIAPQIASRLGEGGVWVVSGIIPDNWPDVRSAAERAGFRLESEKSEDGWVAAVFAKTDQARLRC